MPMPRLRRWVNFYTTELVGWTVGQVADHVSLGLGHVKNGRYASTFLLQGFCLEITFNIL